jgi:hypothetical protein
LDRVELVRLLGELVAPAVIALQVYRSVERSQLMAAVVAEMAVAVRVVAAVAVAVLMASEEMEVIILLELEDRVHHHRMLCQVPVVVMAVSVQCCQPQE